MREDNSRPNGRKGRNPTSVSEVQQAGQIEQALREVERLSAKLPHRHRELVAALIAAMIKHGPDQRIADAIDALVGRPAPEAKSDDPMTRVDGQRLASLALEPIPGLKPLEAMFAEIEGKPNPYRLRADALARQLIEKAAQFAPLARPYVVARRYVARNADGRELRVGEVVDGRRIDAQFLGFLEAMDSDSDLNRFYDAVENAIKAAPPPGLDPKPLVHTPGAPKRYGGPVRDAELERFLAGAAGHTKANKGGEKKRDVDPVQLQVARGARSEVVGLMGRLTAARTQKGRRS